MSADAPAQLPPGLDLLWGRRERGRRGPRPGLSPDAIVAAAMRVADAGGLEAVSMARVAKELGFTTMSLYRHVASKDELLQLMWNASAVGAETLVLEGSDWRERLKSWALFQRDTLGQHPWITQMPLAAPPVAPNSMHFIERALEAMDDSGLPDDDKLRVIGLISSYTLSEARMAYDAARAVAQAGPGQVIVTQAPPGKDDGTPRATTWTWDALLRELVDEKTYPRLHRVAWSPGPAESSDEHAEYLFGLDRILDGVQALIDRQRRLRLEAVPGPVRDRQAARHVGVMRMRQRHVTDRPFHVGAQRGAEVLVPRQSGVIGRPDEALHEPAPQVRHVSHPRVHGHEAGLVAAPVLRIAWGPAHHLGPVRGEPLHVLRILPRVRERVVQLRIRQAPRVVRGSQPQERRVPAREFIQRRLHAPIMAHIFEKDQNACRGRRRALGESPLSVRDDEFHGFAARRVAGRGVPACAPDESFRGVRGVLPRPGGAAAAVARLTPTGLSPVKPYQYWIDNDSIAFADPDGREVIFAPWIFGKDTTPARVKGLR